MSDTQLLLFIMTSILVILSPGQDFVLVLSRSISQGSKAGIVTAAGVSTGLIGHTILASAGLGTILMASDVLFVFIKVIGGAYLFYLGLKLIVSKSSIAIADSEHKPMIKLFLEGAISNISNPKVTLFYFAFLPQFISSGVDNPTGYLIFLGVSFALLTFLIKAPMGYFAGLGSHWIQHRPTIIGLINRISGTVLIGFGARLIVEDR